MGAPFVMSTASATFGCCRSPVDASARSRLRVHGERTKSVGAVISAGVHLFVIPLVDVLMGEDRHNPPEKSCRSWRGTTTIDFCCTWRSRCCTSIFSSSRGSSNASAVVVGVAGAHARTGYTSAGALLIGHELGHKNNALDRRAAQVVNGLVGYGISAANTIASPCAGLHPEDFASARMGESIYKFVLREIPGAIRRGWHMSANDSPGQGTLRGRGAMRSCSRGRSRQ